MNHLVQPRIWWAVRTHCWLISSLLSTSTLHIFSRAVLHLYIPQLGLTVGVAVTQVQEWALKVSSDVANKEQLC